MGFLLSLLVLLVLQIPVPAFAIDDDQLDDFEDGTVMGWTEGALSPNKPTVITTGGPGGTDDKFLQNVSAGGGGAGSKMAMFNRTQWTGDYNAAGVIKIRADMRNLGSAPLLMRIGVQGTSGGGARYVSTQAVTLPADDQWHRVVFDLSQMSSVRGGSSLSAVLSDVWEFRIHAATNVAWQGDATQATLGVDNIRALTSSTPVEAISWGSLKQGYAP